jgi:hypothetical protein
MVATEVNSIKRKSMFAVEVAGCYQKSLPGHTESQQLL